jgi:protein SCO1
MPSSPPAQTSSAASRWGRAGLWAVLGLALATVIVLAVLQRLDRSKRPELPVVAELPGFVLTNRDGREVLLDQLLGRPWVANFIFTRCPGPCPKLSGKMRELGARLPAGVRRVSFSVDPEHDRPEVLESYARRYEAPPEWLFLTGTQQSLYDLLRTGFKVHVERNADEAAPAGPILHSTRLVLVDAEGRVRGYYDAFDPEAVEQLIRDLKGLDGAAATAGTGEEHDGR